MTQHPEYVSPDSAMNFLSDDGGIEHNLCTCTPFSFSEGAARWLMMTVYNNFEIADMEFWRGEAFSAYFDYLDRNGGFYYEVCRTQFHTAEF